MDVLEEHGSDFEGPQVAPFRYSEDSHLGMSGLMIAKAPPRRGGITPTYVLDIGDASVEALGPEQSLPPADSIPGPLHEAGAHDTT